MRKLDRDRRPSFRRMAVSFVNVSLPVAVDLDELLAALRDPTAPFQPSAHRLLEEAPAYLLAGLVAEDALDWRTLAEAAERYPPADDETAAWIRDMARLALA